MKKFILIFTLALFPFLSYLPVKAQNRSYFGLILSPNMERLSIAPGETYSGQLTLTNDFQSSDPASSTFESETVDYNVIVKLFKENPETSGGALFLEDQNLPFNADATRWISFEKESLTLKFSEQTKLGYTIQIPKNVVAGGHYLGILFQKTASDSSGSSVGLRQNLGSLLFIDIKGNSTPDAEVVSFKAESGFFEIAPFKFSLTIKNTGNVHQIIGGDIFLHSGNLANSLGSVPINLSSDSVQPKILLPDSTREFKTEINYGFLQSKDGLKFDLKEFPKMLFGKKTATLKLIYFKDGEKVVEDFSTSFFVFPVRLFLVGLLVLGIISGSVFYTLKNLAKNAKK